MNKEEILSIVNEPSKHIQTAKIVGKDRIVYSSKFVEFLESIPEMFTKDEVQKAIDEVEKYICDVETDTVKAQGMAQALDIFEQVLGDLNNGNVD